MFDVLTVLDFETIAFSAGSAVPPWRSPERDGDRLAELRGAEQARINVCLYNCPYAEDIDACDGCTACRQDEKTGRPKSENTESVVAMLGRFSVAEIAARAGVSRATVYRIIHTVNGQTRTVSKVRSGRVL